MKIKHFKILTLAVNNPKMFIKKLMRRVTGWYRYLKQRTSLFLLPPKMHDFLDKPLPQLKLFDLYEGWANTTLPTKKELLSLLNGEITIFGHTTAIDAQNPRWGDDLRLPQEKNPQLADIFSLNIPITQSTSQVPSIFGYDIKYAWERSRLQFLIPLGKMYSQDPASHENLYHAFKTEINSWITHNPFMFGVNWMNAMEVGIRASNLIWLFSFFYSEKNAENDRVFWNLYINMLLRHSEFINTHWEDFDKPNNHYLLDLTGAWYLALFFANLRMFPFGNLANLWDKICSGFDVQINNDGTHYEGSTAYHQLIIQSLRHIELLGKDANLQLPEHLSQKLQKGIQFLADCTIERNILIQIGDNDSGSLITTLDLNKLPDEFERQKHQQIPCVREYPDFGCIFIINNDWHISLRTGSFNENSPHGHFHQDHLSITVAYQGVPFLIDSGTGCYTPNTTTRNMLRSWRAHSTIHQTQTPYKELADLFDLKSPQLKPYPTLIAGSAVAPTATAQYQDAEIKFTRSIKLNGEQNYLLVTDIVESIVTAPGSLEANLILAAEVIPQHNKENAITLQSGLQKLCIEYSTEYPPTVPTFISQSYGKLTRTTKLSANATTPYRSSFKLTPKM